MKDQEKKIAVSELVIDDELLKLRPVNMVFVSRYRQAYRTGANFPPIVIDQKTKMITSGNHRATALKGEYSESHKVSVLFRKYKDRIAILEDFTKENSSHGNPIDGITKKRITRALIDEGVTAERIAELFNVPVKRIETLGDEVALVICGPNEQQIRPVKRGLHTDKPITEKQYDEHIKSDRGIEFKGLAGQINRWIDNGWIEQTPDTLKVATALEKSVQKFLKSFDKKAA